MIRVITKARLVALSILVIAVLPTYSKAGLVVEEPESSLEIFLQEKDVHCLAKNIYFESRGEPKEGKVAVGIVTLNRVDNPDFPKTICGVVNHKTKSRTGKTVCQFSWACKRSGTPKASDPMWEESLKIAKKLLTGNYIEWQTKYGNAHYFHNAHVNPKWNLRRVARVGRHIFYS